MYLVAYLSDPVEWPKSWLGHPYNEGHNLSPPNDRVKVRCKKLVGTNPQRPTMFRRACFLRKQLCTNECKLSFFQEKNSTTCLELLDIFQA